MSFTLPLGLFLLSIWHLGGHFPELAQAWKTALRNFSFTPFVVQWRWIEIASVLRDNVRLLPHNHFLLTRLFLKLLGRPDYVPPIDDVLLGDWWEIVRAILIVGYFRYLAIYTASHAVLLVDFWVNEAWAAGALIQLILRLEDLFLPVLSLQTFAQAGEANLICSRLLAANNLFCSDLDFLVKAGIHAFNLQLRLGRAWRVLTCFLPWCDSLDEFMGNLDRSIWALGHALTLQLRLIFRLRLVIFIRLVVITLTEHLGRLLKAFDLRDRTWRWVLTVLLLLDLVWVFGQRRGRVKRASLLLSVFVWSIGSNDLS